MHPLDDPDRRLVEAAATGISGATGFGDQAYVRHRHDELVGAAQRLARRGLAVEPLLHKARTQLRTSLRGDVEATRRLAGEIIRLLTFL